MAKLYVSTDVIENLLFGDHMYYGVRIKDASYEDGCLVLEVEGSLIPEGAEVVDCVISRRVVFNAVR